MKNFYIKTVELAQLSRSKICLETDDFELKVNLPYFDKDGVSLNTKYSNNNSILCISFFLDLNCKEEAEFSALVTGRLVEGYTYFITQAGNKVSIPLPKQALVQGQHCLEMYSLSCFSSYCYFTYF